MKKALLSTSNIRANHGTVNALSQLALWLLEKGYEIYVISSRPGSSEDDSSWIPHVKMAFFLDATFGNSTLTCRAVNVALTQMGLPATIDETPCAEPYALYCYGNWSSAYDIARDTGWFTGTYDERKAIGAPLGHH